MTTLNKAREFLSRWRMTIVDSNRRTPSYPKHITYYQYDDINNMPTHYETEILHTIQIPESALEALVDFYERVEESMKYTGSMDVFNHYIERQNADKAIREKYPTVQKAYDQYMMLHKLAKSGENNARR